MSALDDHLKWLVSEHGGEVNEHPDDLTSLEQWQRSSGYLQNWKTLTDKFVSGLPLSLLNEPLYPIEAGFDEDKNMSSFLHSQQRREERGKDSVSTSARLLSHPTVQLVAEPAMTILQSKRPDDDISAELAELLGFENIDLVMELIHNRSQIVEQLADEERARVSKRTNKQHEPLEDLSPEAARWRMENALEAAAHRPLFTGTAGPEAEILPHVYTSASMITSNAFSPFGAKYILPIGTERKYFEDYEEVIVPPAKVVPPRISERLIPCSELPPLAKPSFAGYQTLNRIQSIVYPTAFGTNENMLICAPTGAGKTDVAMLTVLRVVDQHRSRHDGDVASSVVHNSFKIIYVAPMKALASEITRKLGKRLAWLRIKVRELTGDMQLTKAEIAETQIIVTTPEKWDVVTRKPTGEGELATKVKLLIIDEVHLLNDERGAVIETIVARTIRQVESTQSMIRIVGLSATLPNYIDVADFLHVSRQVGLFYFDSSFRPVPLETRFIGIKGKSGSPTSRRNFDRVTYERVLELVREGHQVMVFVHARKETVKAALALKEAATQEGDIDFFSCADDPRFAFFRRDIGMSKNKEMKQLFDSGFGIHHAGMLRSDRNLMERLFEARAIKVLCCTATLAWGVNLPAHAVIIKGTQLYDPAQGKFVDLSILDVLQIFGRAGRPGMESSGVGYICTTEDKLTHYLDAITAQHPIESKFTHGLRDALNAEIALGTVANVAEGAQWISYTYYFVRMRKNPMVYGLTHEDPVNDPGLTEHSRGIITGAARELAKVGMIQFDEVNSKFASTDVGRIAAKYYIRHASIEVFQKEFKPRMTEADVLALLSMSTEFDQIQVRENEVKELENLKENIPCDVKGGTDTSRGKVNILVQAYISGCNIEDFALVSDTMYAAQNAGRIIRALLEIALSRKWAGASAVLMSMSKTIEKQMWGYEHPLAQFDLSADVLYNLRKWADDLDVWELAAKSAGELGTLIHLNGRHGAALQKAAKQFPTLSVSHRLRPLSHDLLKISLHIERAFEWAPKIHGAAEPFWIWVEDEQGINILQLARTVFGPSTTHLSLDFIIPVPDRRLPVSVQIRAISDKWIGAEDDYTIPFHDISMPIQSHWHTPLLPLPFLPITALKYRRAEQAYGQRFQQFNSIQTQAFWSIYNTDRNVLIAGPVSSGKSILGQLAIWRQIAKYPSKSVLVIVSRWNTAKSTAWNLRDVLGTRVDLLLRPQDLNESKSSQVRVTTAKFLHDTLFSQPDRLRIKGLGLVVCEELELLDGYYELGLSRLLHASQTLPIRFVGVSCSINDPIDLASWLRVSAEGCYSFRPTDRDQALSITAQTFTIPPSAILFKVMAKPLYDTLRSLPATDTCVVFVPTRGQCANCTADLIRLCAVEMSMRGFLSSDVEPEALVPLLGRLENSNLADGLLKGIGIWHEGIDRSDAEITLRLFLEGVVRVLIVPREAAWTLPARAGLVVVMGTQYVDIKPSTSPKNTGERQVMEYTLHELVRMQGRAIRHAQTGRFHVMCQAEHRDTYMRFLHDGLPLESGLVDSPLLTSVLGDLRKKGFVSTKQDALDLLGFTFLAKRIETNPVYYDTPAGGRDIALSRLVDLVFQDTELRATETAKDDAA